MNVVVGEGRDVTWGGGHAPRVPAFWGRQSDHLFILKNLEREGKKK